jgi:hypothetical protein
MSPAMPPGMGMGMGMGPPPMPPGMGMPPSAGAFGPVAPPGGGMDVSSLLAMLLPLIAGSGAGMALPGMLPPEMTGGMPTAPMQPPIPGLPPGGMAPPAGGPPLY